MCDLHVSLMSALMVITREKDRIFIINTRTHPEVCSKILLRQNPIPNQKHVSPVSWNSLLPK